MSGTTAGGLITGGFSLLTLIVAQIANYFKDKRTAAVEEKRFEKELSFRKAALWQDRRFELYSNYLSATWDFATAFPIIAAASDTAIIPKHLEWLGNYESGPKSELRKVISDISLSASDEISNLAAALDSKLYEVNQELLILDAENQDSLILKAKEARQLHMNLRVAMRAEIHL